MPGTPKRSGARLIRGKPKPPERDAMHQYLGQEAGRLLSEYRRAQGKRGPGAGRRKVMIKDAALDLLRHAELPVSVVTLFGVMLDTWAAGLLRGMSTPPWLDKVVDYEAHAHNENRLVDNAEITDKVVLPNHPEISDRKYVMRRVREVRGADWYPTLRDARRIYLMDNPDSV